MKTETAPLKSVYDLEKEWGDSNDNRSCKMYIYDYMQAYADQQVNQVLTHAVDTIKKEYGESNAYFILTYLESLKIKKP